MDAPLALGSLSTEPLYSGKEEEDRGVRRVKNFLLKNASPGKQKLEEEVGWWGEKNYSGRQTKRGPKSRATT